MKKLIAIAAFAVFFTGCDIVSGDASVVASVSNITINEVELGASSGIQVQIWDVSGRPYMSSHHSNVTSESFPLQVDANLDIYNGSRSYYLVVLNDVENPDVSDRLGMSAPFSGDDLAAAAGTSFDVVATLGSLSAELSVSGQSAE